MYKNSTIFIEILQKLPITRPPCLRRLKAFLQTPSLRRLVAQPPDPAINPRSLLINPVYATDLYDLHEILPYISMYTKGPILTLLGAGCKISYFQMEHRSPSF